MKKLIAVLVSASVMSTGALAEDAQQAANPNKSDAVMQQLADNGSTATEANSAEPAKKEKKHHRHHHHHAKKDKTAEAAPTEAAPSETPAAS